MMAIFCWRLGAAMEPIEKLFLIMAVIGVVGFVTIVVYLTHH